MKSNLAKGMAIGGGLVGAGVGSYALGRKQGKQTNEKKVQTLRQMYGNQIERQRQSMHNQNEAVGRFLRSYAQHRKG